MPHQHQHQLTTNHNIDTEGSRRTQRFARRTPRGDDDHCDHNTIHNSPQHRSATANNSRQYLKLATFFFLILPCRHKQFEKLFTLLDLCVSSLRRGHANLLCIVPILTDDPRRESENGRANYGTPKTMDKKTQNKKLRVSPELNFN